MSWREASISAGVGPGWEPLVDELHEKVQAIVPDARVAQVKEKFGGLRYYPEGAPPRIDIIGVAMLQHRDPAWDDVLKIVREYEQRSFTICEWCGTTEDVETLAPEGRWVKSLCPTHRAEWAKGKRWWT